MKDSCQEIEPVIKLSSALERSSSTSTNLVIDGMNCGNCANRVRNALLETYGVSSVMMDLPRGTAEIQFNPDLTSVQALLEAVSSAGKDGYHSYAARLIPQA